MSANTHAMFDTIDHQHLDSLVYWATGNYPSAGLNLVACADGRWFVEVDHGSLFDEVEGVSRPKISPYKDPTFFETEQLARDFAIASIKVVHPETASKNLQDWFDEYDAE